MKIGKLPENVLKRSVLKQIKTIRPELLIGAGIGEDCAAFSVGEDEVVVMSTDPITGTSADIGRWSVIVSANDIASSGAEVLGILVCALLPPETEESDIKAIMQQMNEVCEELHVQLMGGHTEITDAVTRPLLSITGVGKVKRDKLVATGGGKVGDDLVVTKWIGLEGTSILAKEREELLRTRLPKRLLSEAKGFEKYLSILPEAATAGKSGASAMHDITEGGIFGALWEVAESAGIGLNVDLKKIPIRQETVEISNFFDINPYKLMSSGSLLIASPDGGSLVKELQAQGIHATVIGKLTEGNDRVVCNGEEKRFLEPPKTDELYEALRMEQE
ncbi:MAG: AIR synthase family protein [Lachnospiraceae bacterium]|nr:AIR synthase family protein [Lachnospiraceae bacterium]